MTWIILLFLLGIIVSLGFGLYYLLTEGGTKSRRLFTALSWRVGLQVALILFLVLAFFMGWIQPHGGPLDAPPDKSAPETEQTTTP